MGFLGTRTSKKDAVNFSRRESRQGGKASLGLRDSQKKKCLGCRGGRRNGPPRDSTRISSTYFHIGTPNYRPPPYMVFITRTLYTPSFHLSFHMSCSYHSPFPALNLKPHISLCSYSFYTRVQPDLNLYSCLEYPVNTRSSRGACTLRTRSTTRSVESLSLTSSPAIGLIGSRVSGLRLRVHEFFQLVATRSVPSLKLPAIRFKP